MPSSSSKTRARAMLEAEKYTKKCPNTGKLVDVYIAHYLGYSWHNKRVLSYNNCYTQ